MDFLSEMKIGHGVKEGDLLGHIADLGKDSAGRQMPSMLHIELYAKTMNGALSQPGSGKYGRRADLLDPTPILNQLAAELKERLAVELPT